MRFSNDCIPWDAQSEDSVFVYTKFTRKTKNKGKRKKEEQRKTKDFVVVTRATNATRVRPEDDSTYVTTLFELTGFEFLSSVGRQKCQKCHIRSDEQIEQIRSDQIRSDQTVEKRTVL